MTCGGMHYATVLIRMREQKRRVGEQNLDELDTVQCACALVYVIYSMDAGKCGRQFKGALS